MTGPGAVTVVVPVYRGRPEVQACLESVLRHGARTRDIDVLVIDDASPEPDVVAYVSELERADTPVPLRVMRNEENLGFVTSVNAGLAESEGDVVILNADTVVTAGWLDRLADAGGQGDVATVTPLTNFGSVCTLPRPIIGAFGLDGPTPRIDDCARFIEATSLRLRPEVITGVGFCLYVTRAAIDVVGPLDVEAFGSGYGEEVDFCLRAGRLGFRHLVEDATYVHHHGGVSFGPERQEGLDRGSALLHRRYRWFREANRRERADDPLRVSFTALELGLADRDPTRPHVLHLLHGTPDSVGGTEKHVWALIDALRDEFDFSILYPVESGFVLRTWWDVGVGRPLVREHLFPGAARAVTDVVDPVAAEALRLALDLFEFDAVHIQHLKGHSLAALDVLAAFDGPVTCSVRDQYPACPQYSLLYRDIVPCGIPEDLSYCERCLPETQEQSLDYLLAFRDRLAARLDVVDRWVFASQSAADYLLRVYDLDEDRIEIIPHGAIIDPDRGTDGPDTARIFDEPLRLAFVGRGWTKKGLGLVNGLADRFADAGIELHHFGATKEPWSDELYVHGPYDNDALPELLHGTGIQIVLLPGPYAETFGHVLTEATIAGLPVVAAPYGALGERLRRSGAGWTIDPEDPAELERLIVDLDRCREEVLRATMAARAQTPVTVAETAGRYAALYRAAPEQATK